jgi:hypothetical protein
VTYLGERTVIKTGVQESDNGKRQEGRGKKTGLGKKGEKREK